jgi:hypothetical protein
MPLLDHFNPPLYPARHWESFHGQWASAIANSLNQQLLPKSYFAEMQVHIGSRVEVDIATLEQGGDVRDDKSEAGGVAILQPRVWSPPVATMSIPANFPDSIEVLVYDMEAGYTLVGAIELVSPGNKDRDETRRAFAAKCATYLQQGIGLITVDVVTSRHGNLHNDLIELLDVGKQFILADGGLAAVAYRPIRHAGNERIDVWPASLAVGRVLPLLPLGLDKGLVIPLDLEPTYVEACQRSRLQSV